MELPELSGLTVNLIAWLIGVGLTLLATETVKAVRRRRITRFWVGFGGPEPLRLIVNERLIRGDDPLSKTGRAVGDGFYVTKGMAGAVARIWSFACRHLVAPSQMAMVGSMSGGLNATRVICLGSADNAVTQELLKKIKEHFSFDFKVTPAGLELHNGEVLEANVDDETGDGVDYALVVRARLPKSSAVQEILILAGIHMYGTEGAAIALTDGRSLGAISAEVCRFRNCAFVLRVKVEKHRATTGELELGNRQPIIDELGRRRPGKKPR
jgi:hypothetical protein